MCDVASHYPVLWWSVSAMAAEVRVLETEAEVLTVQCNGVSEASARLQLCAEHAQVSCRCSWRRPCMRRPWCWSARTGPPGGLTRRMWSTSCCSTSPEIPQSMCGGRGGSPGAQAAPGWSPSWSSAARSAVLKPALAPGSQAFLLASEIRCPGPQRHDAHNLVALSVRKMLDESPGSILGHKQKDL